MCTTLLYSLCESQREKVHDDRGNMLSQLVYNYYHGIHRGFLADCWDLTMHAYQEVSEAIIFERHIALFYSLID